MPTKPITSVEVAELAGVSQPTVSRAFDPNASVAPATRARILEAAKTLGYQPNVIARSLKSQRTNIVGLVMANLTNSFFYPQVLDALTGRLQANGKQSLLFNTAADRPVDDILPLILGYRVDALVIASTTPSDDVIEECTRLGTPVILLNRFGPETSANSVCCDNVAGGRQAADVLIDSGRQRLAFISGLTTTATNTMREAGFMQRVQERGREVMAVENGAFTYESGYAAAHNLLRQTPRPDGIFCAADIMALGAIDAARALGVSIPEDLAIIGFDDIPVASWPAYNLTTIRQPINDMVDTAVAMITAAHIPTGHTHLLPGTLIERGSV